MCIFFLLVNFLHFFLCVFIEWNVDSFKRTRSVVRGKLKYVYRFPNLQESEVRKRARYPEKSISIAQSYLFLFVSFIKDESVKDINHI